MTSKTTYIPRYLLPQYGALWRTASRPAAFPRPLNAELGQVLVRYASKTVASKSTTTPKTTTPKTPKIAATKVAAPKAASTKASSKSAGAKAAKASAPTKPPAKLPSKPVTKPTATTATTKPVAPKASAVKPKTPAPAPATAPSPPPAATKPAPAAPAREPVAKAAAATPAAKPAAAAPRPASPSKPIVLEKPERFNPPSHGARLPRSTPRHYGGPMSDAELQAQSVKAYPGLPPPENTWSHWFIHSRSIHLIITLGTLTSLAVYTFITSFKAKSPFADMIPPASEFVRHPFQYLGVLVDIMRLHEEHESALTAEKRRRRVEDVAKRNEYRKAHGLEPAQGFWAAGQASQPEPEPEPQQQQQPVESSKPRATIADEFTPDGKRKKFLGIF
ncbi:hypothetical protein GGR52DRAFT_567694 [Hypoxylon sp. FL1284]|nr:hypothetical protein GGR52DRAFT_567694 [Hypoxylon sp. FL1284]